VKNIDLVCKIHEDILRKERIYFAYLIQVLFLIIILHFVSSLYLNNNYH
jgi:hypothetical protein